MEKGEAETVSPSQKQAVIDRAKEADERGRKADIETSTTSSALEDEKAAAEIVGEFENDDESSEMLNDMDLDDIVDDFVDDLSEDENDEDEDEESESVKGILRYSEVMSMERNMTEAIEEEQGPRSRWLMTTCRYCGDIYRFRSDQPQPPTCGRAQCIAKFEERSRKEVA